MTNGDCLAGRLTVVICKLWGHSLQKNIHLQQYSLMCLYCLDRSQPRSWVVHIYSNVINDFTLERTSSPSQVVWLVPMETLIEAKLVNLEASMSSMWCNQQHVLHVPKKREEQSDIKILCHTCAAPYVCTFGTMLRCAKACNNHSSRQHCLWFCILLH